MIQKTKNPQNNDATGRGTQRAKVGDKDDALSKFDGRRAKTLDEKRPAAVAKRHQQQLRTARENLADLCDIDTFIEFGQLAVAAQRSRKSLDELAEKTPADGVISGLGVINADLFDGDAAKAAILVNDYTVLAATQGYFHHKKIDRLLSVARDNYLPVVMYSEGGGGRPGDTDVKALGTGLAVTTFSAWAALPTLKISVNRGYCFAGNAVLFGCADIKIATRDSCIGMAGPAMIEGGGLGKHAAETIGPASEQSKLGVIDILVDDEAQATKMAKQLLGFFQGDLSDWSCSDQSLLWDVLPKDRRFSYDVGKLISGLADTGSFVELQAEFGCAVVVGFLRIEGKPMAVIANDTRVLGGAIDSDAAEKSARFLQLCERTQMPILSLCDTPGFMVGPDSEKQGAVKAMADMYIAGSRLTVPIVSVVIRKAYGLGAMAMVMGDFLRPIYSAAWPTGEFGGMGLEGAVNLGYKKELDAAPTPEARQALFDTLLAEMYEQGLAAEVASLTEIDAVIEPKGTRLVILRALASAA